MSTPVSVLPPIPQSLPKTQPDWQQLSNVMQQWQQILPTSASAIGQLLYPQTAAEIAASVTPSNYAYPSDPYVDPRRYGADPTGAKDSSIAVQAACTVAIAGSSAVIIAENCNYLVTGLTLALPSTSGTKGLRIFGASVGGSRLTLNGTTGTLLTVSASSAGAPTQANFVMENLTLYAPSTNTATGLSMEGIAWWELRGLYIESFSIGLNLSGSLSGTIRGGAYLGSTTAIYARPNATYGTGNNLIRILEAELNGNGVAIDYDGSASYSSTNLSVKRCDLESNTGVAAIHIGPNIAQSLGYAIIDLDGNYFESNSGNDIKVDNPAAGQTFIRIANSMMLNGGTSLNILGAQNLLIENCTAPETGSTWTISSSVTYCSIRNSLVFATLGNGGSDSSVYPVYENVQDAGHRYTWGRPTQWTATLTGVSATTTATVTSYQQGQQIKHVMPGLTATSNTTAKTITGMPAAFYPAANINGIGPIAGGAGNPETGQVYSVGTGGTITLYYAGSPTGFAASGLAGLDQCQIEYRIN